MYSQVQSSIVQYSSVWSSMVQCSTVQSGLVPYCPVESSRVSIVQYRPVLSYLIPYRPVQCNIVQNSLVKSRLVQYSPVLSNIVQSRPVLNKHHSNYYAQNFSKAAIKVKLTVGKIIPKVRLTQTKFIFFMALHDLSIFELTSADSAFREENWSNLRMLMNACEKI